MPPVPRSSLPPGPSGRFAPTLRYLRDPFRFYEDAQKRFGDLISMNSMNGQLVITFSPEGARQILAGREEDFYVGFGVDAVVPLVGPGSLLITSGDQHRRDRKRLSPTFHGGRMRAYADQVEGSVRACTNRWTAGQEITLRNEMEEISSEVIVRTVFGVNRPERSQAFRTAIREAVNEVPTAPIFFKFLQRRFAGFGPWANFLRAKQRLDDLIFDQIKVAKSMAKPGEDILSKLITLETEDGMALSDTEIRDHIFTLLFAGHETTATSLSWVLYELMRNPAELRWLRSELESLGDAPRPDELAAHPALDAAIRESLRLHPVLLEFMRTVKTEFELEGWKIPAGVTVAGAIPMIHRNQELYPDPLRYRPQRFIERKFAPHEFATFGGGHRHCLGAAFAIHEMTIAVGTIVREFDLSLLSDQPLRPVRRNATIAPEGGVPTRVDAIRVRNSGNSAEAA